MRAAGADLSGRGVGFVRSDFSGRSTWPCPFPSCPCRLKRRPNLRRRAARHRLGAAPACARRADDPRRDCPECGSTGRRGVGREATDQSRGRTAHRDLPPADPVGRRRTGGSTGPVHRVTCWNWPPTTATRPDFPVQSRRPARFSIATRRARRSSSTAPSPSGEGRHTPSSRTSTLPSRRSLDWRRSGRWRWRFVSTPRC